MSYSNEPPNYGAPPPPGYGAPPPGYGGGQPQSTSVMAIISLVTGILSIICCGSFVFGIAGVVLGYLGKNEIAKSGGTKKGAGLATAGLVCGAIGIVLSIAYWILFAAGAIDFSYT